MNLIVVITLALLFMGTAGLARAAMASAAGAAAGGRVRGGAGAPRGWERAALRTPWPKPPSWVARRLEEAEIAVSPDAAFALWWAALALLLALAYGFGGGGLAIVAITGGVGGSILLLVLSGGRAGRRLEEALPDAMEAVARALRSGASLRQAVEEAGASASGRLAGDLTFVSKQCQDGQALVEALDHWADRRRPLAGVRLAVAALALGAQTGGAQAKAIDGVAATLRSRLAVAKEVHALSSQARLSGLVIILAPLAFAVLASTTDPRTAGFLLHTRVGLLCLAAGLGLDLVAATWMHRLAKVDL